MLIFFSFIFLLFLSPLRLCYAPGARSSALLPRSGILIILWRQRICTPGRALKEPLGTLLALIN